MMKGIKKTPTILELGQVYYHSLKKILLYGTNDHLLSFGNFLSKNQKLVGIWFHPSKRSTCRPLLFWESHVVCYDNNKTREGPIGVKRTTRVCV
jgi:hypothetical protein